jgi:hypothetical protein
MMLAGVRFMPLVSDSLWALALSGQPIDAGELASALDE